jgi:hypothetical protein
MLNSVRLRLGIIQMERRRAASRTKSPYAARKINRTVPYRRCIPFALDSFERERNRIVGSNALYGTIPRDSPLWFHPLLLPIQFSNSSFNANSYLIWYQKSSFDVRYPLNNLFQLNWHITRIWKYLACYGRWSQVFHCILFHWSKDLKW